MPLQQSCRRCFSSSWGSSFSFRDKTLGIVAGARWAGLALTAFLLCCTSFAATTKQYVLTVDPQALAIAQTAFTTMGGVNAIAGYQDSLASGTATIYSGDSSISCPITIKSKGLRETRVELQMTKGKNVGIVNQGQGSILRPDGSIQNLYANNTFYEHVNHVPLLSVLAEYANGNVNL